MGQNDWLCQIDLAANLSYSRGVIVQNIIGNAVFKAVRAFADVTRITFLGPAGLLFQAFIEKHLTLGELENAKESLNQTIWLSAPVVSETFRKAREADR